MCHLVDQAIKPPILLAGPLAPRSRKSRRGPLFSWTWSCGDRVNKACFIWILAQKEVVTRKKPTSVFQIEKMHWPIDALKIVNGENDALHNQSKEWIVWLFNLQILSFVHKLWYWQASLAKWAKVSLFTGTRKNWWKLFPSQTNSLHLRNSYARKQGGPF